METYYGYDSLPLNGRVVALGNFDGVHKGHQAIIKNTIALARQMDVKSSVFLFEPHPMTLLQPEKTHILLTPPLIRGRVFAQMGLDELILAPFNQEIRTMSYGDFFEKILVRKLGSQGFSVGYDYTFGYKHEGTASLLALLGESKGLKTILQPQIKHKGNPVSSTRIKEAIRKGEMKEAKELLGRDFNLQIERFSFVEEGYKVEFRPDAQVPGPGCYCIDLNLGFDHKLGEGQLEIISGSYHFLHTTYELQSSFKYTLDFLSDSTEI